MTKKNTEEVKEQVKEQVININGKEHNVSGLTAQQQVMVNHIYDLRNKIVSSEFALEQLKFAESSFSKELITSVESEPEEVETEEV